MEYISESSYHFSKSLLQCVQYFTNIPGNKGIVYMFETNYSSLCRQFKKIVACYNKQRGGGGLTFPIFYNELLSSSKQLKIGPKYCGFSNQT